MHHPLCPWQLSPKQLLPSSQQCPGCWCVSGEGRECEYSDITWVMVVWLVMSHQVTAIFDAIALYEQLQKLTFEEG